MIPLAIGVYFLGCSTEKHTGFNRGMQNLTAHYNILFDANQILDQKQADYQLSFIDSYNELLNVYQDTLNTRANSLDKDLQSAVEKGNKIIGYKDQSHYVGDAYLVLGKANFLGSQYFNANEYFNYVTESFRENKDLVEEAMVWKARTLMYLNKLPAAKLVIDTALDSINVKKHIAADVYATKLQYDIDVQDYTDGEAMAKLAVQYCHTTNQRLRWTFILAQLEELNNQTADAYANYTKIARSNAVFEMSFNADLNRIRIEDAQNGVKISRIDKLRSLLKNPNNKEFKDQIYYQIAQLYFADKAIDNAIKNYKLSIATSVKNQNQKGISYLRVADINFNIKANYVVAKKYYDSTLTTLSPNYPGYSLIQKKTNNLQLLTDRLRIIGREDTLQMLAKLDDKTRRAKIDTMVLQHTEQMEADAKNAAATKANNNIGGGNLFSNPGGGNSTFYFYNSNAVSQGYQEFKRLWGNRKLEDDWRRSGRNQSNSASTAVSPNQGTLSTSIPTVRSTESVAAANYRQQIVLNLPTTPDLVAQSNLRIYNALFDIANFYRDILDDKKEAVNTYENILKRFPNSPNRPAIDYSLYRLYSELNSDQADKYKNELLKTYPETAFAKVILDPDYSKKNGDKESEFKALYNQIYDLYAKRRYNDVMARVDEVMKQYPTNSLAAQLYYLRAISAGHSESTQQFKADLEQIVKNYPNDRLIVPLVKQHIDYINANLVDMSARHNALLYADTTAVPFAPLVENKKETPYRVPGRHFDFDNQVADVRKPVKKPDSVKTPEHAQAALNTPVTVAAPVKKQPYSSKLFSIKDSTNYYFIINISNDNTNPASSRFGIGQFNRANFDNKGITHQLMQVGDNNRFIYIGRFYSLNDVKTYARAIVPLLPEIMKIPKEKYTFFIITRANLDKLVDKKTIDSYVDYYQNNY
ncbi:type IX secretion system periplasmic lipoprotein PorW/SprE [Mucilaginibacter sp.]